MKIFLPLFLLTTALAFAGLALPPNAVPVVGAGNPNAQILYCPTPIPTGSYGASIISGTVHYGKDPNLEPIMVFGETAGSNGGPQVVSVGRGVNTNLVNGVWQYQDQKSQFPKYLIQKRTHSWHTKPMILYFLTYTPTASPTDTPTPTATP